MSVSAVSLFWLTFGPALAAALVALAGDAFSSTRRGYGAIGAASLLGAGGLSGLVGGWTVESGVVHDVFAVGSGVSTVAGLTLMLSAVCIAGSLDTPFGRRGPGAALVSLAAIGSALAASSHELVTTLFALEIAAVCAYALVSLGPSRPATESALKYFMQGAVASGILVAGLALFAGATGGDLAYRSLLHGPTSPSVRLALLSAALLVVVTLAFKIAAAPLHSWAPDAYENAPVAAAAALAGPSKLAAATALTVFVMALVQDGESPLSPDGVAGDIAIIVAGLAVLSMVVGSLTGLVQRSYRRMLGYAGVAQIGYALAALAALDPRAAIIHLSAYAVASVGVFVAADAFKAARPDWDGTIEGLAGLGRRHPVLGSAVTVALASLAGLPPLAGFWGKFQVLSAPAAEAMSLREGGPEWAVALHAIVAAAVMAGSVVSLGYYGAVVRQLFFAKPPAHGDTGMISRAGSVPVLIAVVLMLSGAAPILIGLGDSARGFLLQ